MKVSPVQGTPTIPNPASTGLSPEKLLRIKAIAGNQNPADIPPEEKQTTQLGEPTTSATRRITMNTNKTINRYGDAPPLQETTPPVAEEPAPTPETTVAVSDTSEQTQSVPVASRPISPELAELAKQRRALQIKEREIADKEKLLQEKQSSEDLLKELDSAPLSFLLKHGVTYDRLTNELLAQQGQQAPQQPQDLTKFQDELLKKVEEKLAGKDTAQEEAVFSFMRKEVDKLSFSSNDYRLIRESKSQDDVMDYVRRMWKEKGEVVDEKEAMDAIEFELREDARRYAKVIGELETPPQAPAEQPPVQATASQRGVIKTLTNKDSARPTLSRRQRAIAAMLGQK